MLGPWWKLLRQGEGNGGRGWCTSPPFFGKSRHICQIFVREQNLADHPRRERREREDRGMRRLKWIGFVPYIRCMCIYDECLNFSLSPEILVAFRSPATREKSLLFRVITVLEMIRACISLTIILSARLESHNCVDVESQT